MIQQSLPANWTLRAVGGDLADVPASIKDRDIPAIVPGVVHTDLLAAKLIDDPYFGSNELKVEWIGRTDWRYSTTFKAEERLFSEERIELVCEGLDTIARVELNGALVGESVNMHVPARFDVKKHLKKGENQIAITFSSALKYALAQEAKMGTLPHVEKHPYNFIRKMACNFGWDWGPTLVTAGIWMPIRLEAWSVARIKYVRPLIKEANAQRAVIDVCVDIETTSNQKTLPMQVVLKSPDAVTVFESDDYAIKTGTISTTVTVPQPQLWWPRGHGEQPLYDLSVQVRTTPAPKKGDEGVWNDSTCASWKREIGLRQVKLNTAKDSIGSQFTLEVNGKPVFCKGANWIPDDCFPHRVTKERYAQRLQQAVDSNMNMLRIWGGGIFETETFYSLCDQLGIMVWQDFLFACAMYPEEEPLSTLVAIEARHNVARLSSHPSLAIWNGCNENVWGWWLWGWKEKVGNRTWGFGYYTKLLPSIIAELDPSRPYWPASPYSGSLEINPLDDNNGNKHIWDAWNETDYTVYRKYVSRFVSEFGHQAPPTYATIRQSIPENELKADSPSMLHHQKATKGNEKLHNRLSEHFEIPSNFDDWVYTTQLNQARALQTGVEWFRSRQPVCMGSLYWQINDCWPVTSWACVDGYGRKKPLWYATRRFHADRLLTIQPEKDGSLNLFVLNDTDARWQSDAGELSIRKFNFATGEFSSPIAATINVPARGAQTIALSGPFAKPGDPSKECIVAQCGKLRALWFFEIDKNLAYPAPQYDAEVFASGDEYRVAIKAKTFLRDLALFIDRLDPDAEVSDQLVDLLPGETAVFTFRSSKPLSKTALTSAPVLQCANRFGKR
ncbi:MAG TPA: glycoside hydrolase family 2 protein [Planctomycetota bacterium]|nr:glycoside hydrolase family 2 protein [Planctomycetota bacterium]